MPDSSDKRFRFTASIRIRAPEALPDAIALAAGRNMTTQSEYARQAILARLRADGFCPAELSAVA